MAIVYHYNHEVEYYYYFFSIFYIFYFAIPPSVFVPSAKAIKASGLTTVCISSIFHPSSLPNPFTFLNYLTCSFLNLPFSTTYLLI